MSISEPVLEPRSAERTADPTRRPARALDYPTRTRWADREPWHDLLTSIALLCVAVLFMESVANVLPDGTWFWLITPSRAVLVIGLVATALVVPHPSAWRTWLDVPLLVLLLTSLLASFGRSDSMAGWRWLLTEVGFYYLVVMVRRTHRDTHRATLVFALVGIATPALVALQQSAAQTPTGFCRAPGAGMADGCDQPGALVRVIGTFGNPNLLAAFLLLILPLAWLAVDEWLNRSMRLAGWVVVAMAYVALVDTWSRAGIAAAVLGVVALVTLLRPTGRRLRVGGLLLVGGLLVAVSLVLVSGAGIRTQLWRAAVGLAVHHPLGVGMGRSGVLLTQAIPGSLQFQHAHNTWLNWLVEAGWLGFAAVVAITVLVCWRAWRSAREGSRIAAACGAGLLGIGMMSLADHPANALRIALAMAFVIGVLMSSSLSDQSIRAGLPPRLASLGRRRPRPEPRSASFSVAERLAVPAGQRNPVLPPSSAHQEEPVEAPRRGVAPAPTLGTSPSPASFGARATPADAPEPQPVPSRPFESRPFESRPLESRPLESRPLEQRSPFERPTRERD